MTPSWLTIFIDLPAEQHAGGSAFWRQATGYEISPSRGEHDEFTTLVPDHGDAHLKIQRTGAQQPGVHLDLHVPDLDVAVQDATRAGAELVSKLEHAVLRSPAGFTFCLVTEAAATAAAPRDWGTHLSRVDQLAIDIPPDDWENETAFWAELTGWALLDTDRPEFNRLAQDRRLPVRILLQRLDEGAIGGHLDIATDDRGAEISRLTALGAQREREGAGWTVLTTPGGTACVTDRDPTTGGS